MAVKDLDSLKELIARVRRAQEEFSKFDQETVDKIFRKVAQRINDERITLAKMAVEETGMGIIEDKVIKNHFASEYIYNKYKDEKTCGVLEEDKSYGVKKVATPIGVIAGVVPTTNPTSTAANIKNEKRYYFITTSKSKKMYDLCSKTCIGRSY